MYSAAEYGTVDVPLADLLEGGALSLFPEVVSKKYFEIDLRGDRLILRAGGYVGLIPLNPRVAIEVRPRVPIGNLARILRLSGRIPVAIARQAKDYSLDDEPNPSLLDQFALALLDGVREIEFLGLHREYQVIRADTSMPRGRIDVGRTLVRHNARHRLDRVSATWHQVTVDTAPNRCLKFALWLLAQRYSRSQPRSGSRNILNRLSNCYRVFDGVELDTDLRFLDDATIADTTLLPPLRHYYARPVQIAAAIIRNQSIRLNEVGHQVRMASLVIDMGKVFEAYVREVLRNGLQRSDLRALDGNLLGPGFGAKLLFDSAPSEEANPDVVVRHELAEETEVVVDAKYKPVTAASDRSDINQAIAYGASYRCPRVVLVHPCPSGRQSGLSLLGTIGSLRIYQYMLELGGAALVNEESLLVGAIANLS